MPRKHVSSGCRKLQKDASSFGQSRLADAVQGEEARPFVGFDSNVRRTSGLHQETADERPFIAIFAWPTRTTSPSTCPGIGQVDATVARRKFPRSAASSNGGHPGIRVVEPNAR